MKYSLIITLIVLISETGFSQDCLCAQRGYGSSEGDLPEFIFQFSDSTKLSFCGYMDKKESDSSFYISEFNIFTCDSFENILGYSAVHSCKVFYGNDTVFINRLKNFPIGPNQEWVSFPFSQRVICITGDKLNISEETVILNIPNNYGFKATTVLSQQFEKMNYKEISNYIGQVTILALKGNEPAVKILFSKKLEDHCNAATAEYLRDSKEVYKWTIKGEKSKIHWR